MKINIKGIEIKFHFGMAMFDIFCGELGYDFDDLGKIGIQDNDDKLTEKEKQAKIQSSRKITRDLYYSCAKAYSELNETPFSFTNELEKIVQLKPLHFSDLLTDANFNEEFGKILVKAMESNLPDVKQEKKKQGEKIPLLVGQK